MGRWSTQESSRAKQEPIVMSHSRSELNASIRVKSIVDSHRSELDGGDY